MGDSDSIFKQIDTNKDGTLDYQELSGFFTGRDIDSQNIKLIFEQFDKDRSKTIDKDEFVAMCNKFNDISIPFFTAEETHFNRTMTANCAPQCMLLGGCCCCCTCGLSGCCAGLIVGVCCIEPAIRVSFNFSFNTPPHTHTLANLLL